MQHCLQILLLNGVIFVRKTPDECIACVHENRSFSLVTVTVADNKVIGWNTWGDRMFSDKARL